MRSLLRIIQVLFIVQLLKLASGDGTQCTQVFNFDALYSLLPLKQKNYFTYTLDAKQGTFTTTLNETVSSIDTDSYPHTLTLYFNFCDKVNFITTDYCATEVNADQTFALTMIPPASSTTTNCISTDVQRLTSDSRFDNYNFDLINVDSPENGIIYTLNKTGTTFNSSISYIISCDSSNSTNIFTIQGWRRVFNTTYHHYYIEATSYYGCPSLQLSKIWDILSDNKYLMAAAMIAIGGVLCFFGLKIYKPTMFIVGYITGFAAIVVVVGEFVIRYDSESAMAYVCLIIAVFFGVLTGYVTIKTPKIGFFALGMWLGIVIALLLNNAVLYKIQIGNTAVVLWITIGILSLSMGVLSCFFYKHCVMICTGFIGAYLLIRPFGWMIGSFPNELLIAKELQYGTLTEVPSLFYLYMALILLIGMIGIKFQWGMYLLRRQAEEEDDLQLFLADPDFIEMNKGLLDKEDGDLTEKEKKTKAKVIRMQRNVEKEQQKQDRMKKKIQKLKNKGETTGGNDSEDDGEEENDSDDKDGDDSEDEKDKKKGKKKEEKSGIGLGFFGGMFKGKEESKTPKNKKKKGKKQSSDEDDEEEVQEDSDEEDQRKKNKSKLKKTSSKVVEKQSLKQSAKGVAQKKGKNQDSSDEEDTNNNSKKFASMFAGIKKNKPQSDEDDQTNSRKKKDIEMDDLSDNHSAADQADITQVTAPKSNGRKSAASQKEKEGNNGDSSNSEDEGKKSKKNNNSAKNTAQLAKSLKKSKKQ